MAKKSKKPAAQDTLFDMDSIEIPVIRGLTVLEPLPCPDNFFLCNTLETLEEIKAALEAAIERDDLIGIDPEFTGAGNDVKAMRPQTSMTGFSVAVDTRCWYIPIRHRLGETQLAPEVVQQALSPLLVKCKLVTHNGKGDRHVFWKEGYRFRVYADTMTLAHFLRHELQKHQLDERGHVVDFFRKGLKLLSAIELGLDEVVSFNQVIERSGQLKGATPDFSLVSLADATAYACADAWNTLELARKLLPMLDDEKYSAMAPLYRRVAMPFFNLLADIEFRGVRINTKHFETVMADKERLYKKLEAELRDELGWIPDTDDRIRALIYDSWKCDVPYTTKGGKSAVDKKALLQIQASLAEYDTSKAAIVGLLMDLSKVVKILTTYDMRAAAIYEEQIDGIVYGFIHTQFNESGTATNRLSSEGPNLQNQPSRGAEAAEIRGGFVAMPGWYWLTADLSQIEPRLAAMIAQILGDPSLADVLRDDKKGDPYKALAAALAGVLYDAVQKALRDVGKTAMLAIIYGSSANALAENPTMLPLGRNGLPPMASDIQNALDDLFTTHWGLKTYQRNIVFWSIYHKHAESFLGFRRPAFDIGGKGHDWRMKRSSESRQLRNFGIQSCAAEVLKMGMLWAQELITKYKLDDRIQIVLTVHDELDAYVRHDVLDVATALFRHAMTQVWDALVPLKCDVEVGDTWADILEVSKWEKEGRVKSEQDPRTPKYIDRILQEVSPFQDIQITEQSRTIFDTSIVPFADLEPYCWHAQDLGVHMNDPRLPMYSRHKPEGFIVDVKRWEDKSTGRVTYRAKMVFTNGTLDLISWDNPELKEGFYRLDGKYTAKYDSFQVSEMTKTQPRESFERQLREAVPATLPDGRVIRFDLMMQDLKSPKERATMVAS